MDWIIPGTTLTGQRDSADTIETMFQPLFLAGGLTLSQVASVTGLEPYTIQNWVKRGFLPAPQHRRYSMTQLCRILNINMLKSVLSLDAVCELLGYINGRLDEVSDDIIDDAVLYFLFVRLAVRARQLDDPESWKSAMEDALKDYQEPVPGARARVEKALQIMLIAWMASRMRQTAERMLQEL